MTLTTVVVTVMKIGVQVETALTTAATDATCATDVVDSAFTTLTAEVDVDLDTSIASTII